MVHGPRVLRMEMYFFCFHPTQLSLELNENVEISRFLKTCFLWDSNIQSIIEQVRVKSKK